MHTICKIDVVTGMQNLAALRAAVFPLSARNLRGAENNPPPYSARVKIKGVADVDSECRQESH